MPDSATRRGGNPTKRTGHALRRQDSRAISNAMVAIVLELGAHTHSHGGVLHHFHDRRARKKLTALLLEPPADLHKRTVERLRDGLNGRSLPYVVTSLDGKTVITTGWRTKRVKTN